MSNVFSAVCTVGRDAEVRFLPSGQAVLNVTVANNVGFGDKQKTNWVRVAVWGKRAEGELVNYLKKGQQIFVSGELTVGEYQANDGTTKSSLELNATVIDLVGKKNEAGSAPAQNTHNTQKANGYQPQQNTQQRPQQTQPASNNSDAPYDDDIPF